MEELLHHQRPKAAREPLPALPEDLGIAWHKHFHASPPRRLTWRWIAAASVGAAAVITLICFPRQAHLLDSDSRITESLLSYQEMDQSQSPITLALLHYRERP